MDIFLFQINDINEKWNECSHYLQELLGDY